MTSSARSSASFRPFETKILKRPERIVSYLSPAQSRSVSNQSNRASNCSEVITKVLLNPCLITGVGQGCLVVPRKQAETNLAVFKWQDELEIEKVFFSISACLKSA